MTEYKALTFINLPLLDIKKAPGDTITDEEFSAGGQTEDNIQELIDGGSLSTDLNAPLHPDNKPPVAPLAPPTTDVAVDTSDEGKGGVNG